MDLVPIRALLHVYGDLRELSEQTTRLHAYKRATVERLDIPNTLNREVDGPVPN